MLLRSSLDNVSQITLDGFSKLWMTNQYFGVLMSNLLEGCLDKDERKLKMCSFVFIKLVNG